MSGCFRPKAVVQFECRSAAYQGYNKCNFNSTVNMTKRAWVYMACLAGILMSGAAAAYHWAPKSISDERVIASELPYTNELVSFPNTNGTVLAGTLSIPKVTSLYTNLLRAGSA